MYKESKMMGLTCGKLSAEVVVLTRGKQPMTLLK